VAVDDDGDVRLDTVWWSSWSRPDCPRPPSVYIYCIALRALLLLLSLPLLLMTVQIHHVDTKKISVLLSTYNCIDTSYTLFDDHKLM